MAVVMPPGAGPEATLEAIHQLLHNPLGPHASPSAAEQWRHDVDQLMIGDINTPHRGGQQVNHPYGEPMPSTAHSRSLMVLHAPVASLAIVDLWAKLEHCCSGEDSCITIERH
jgi:hypothetical protein